MNFKQTLGREIHSVFLNAREFGEYGEIAGHDAQFVAETLALDMPPSSSDERVSVSYEGITVYVSALDVPEELLAGRKISFRHEEWFVLSSSCDEGLKTIQLYRERA